MNEILQKRIEEAAKKAKADFLNRFNWSGNQETGFKQGAIWMLGNQWIPVKETSPKEDIPNCFVAYKAMDMVLYSTGSYEKDNNEWYVDGVGFNAEVTHWMPIPELKGGE